MKYLGQIQGWMRTILLAMMTALAIWTMHSTDTANVPTPILTRLTVTAARGQHGHGNQEYISHSSLVVRPGEAIAGICVSLWQFDAQVKV